MSQFPLLKQYRRWIGNDGVISAPRSINILQTHISYFLKKELEFYSTDSHLDLIFVQSLVQSRFYP